MGPFRIQNMDEYNTDGQFQFCFHQNIRLNGNQLSILCKWIPSVIPTPCLCVFWLSWRSFGDTELKFCILSTSIPLINLKYFLYIEPSYEILQFMDLGPVMFNKSMNFTRSYVS